MGLLTAIGSGLQTFGGFLGQTLETFSSSPQGSQFLGQLGSVGLEKLGSLIGLKPTTVAGGPPQGFQTSPFTQFGPAPIGPLGRAPLTFPATDKSVAESQRILNVAFASGDMNEVQRAANWIMANEPNTIPFLRVPSAAGSPMPAPPRTPAFTPPAVPASQPFGRQPGDFTGGGMAFPVTRTASFPAPSFLPALFGGGGGVVPASLGGAVMKQLPGILGGFLGGEAIDLALGSGGGGGTPMFRPTMAGARAQFFRTQNPATGQDTWFRPAGRPLLWSGDLTACKRVNKIARRARRKR